MANHWPSEVGIIALEIYFPQSYVSQAKLEKYDGVSPGKYTIGIGQDAMSFCGDREDINSLCLTVTRNLMEKHNIDYTRIGRLEVGTETIVDKSKSVKSVLMQLFADCGNTDLEGVDTINACYGGTAALFNSLNWIESTAWDGRLALVVAGDIAVYPKGSGRPTGGCGVVAILLGPEAPIFFERGIRASHGAHVYDFYKPDLDSEYGRFDSALSIRCYLEALDRTYQLLARKTEDRTGNTITMDSFDAVICHAPFSKLVMKAVGRMLLSDAQRLPKDTAKARYPAVFDLRGINLLETYDDKELDTRLVHASRVYFAAKSLPCLSITKQTGNMYTGSVYAGLISYLTSKPMTELLGKKLCFFSYGSGCQATMFTAWIGRIHTAVLERLLNGISDVKERLGNRQEFEPASFEQVLDLRERTHQAYPYVPIGPVQGSLAPGTYYLAEVDGNNRRFYKRFEGSASSGNVKN